MTLKKTGLPIKPARIYQVLFSFQGVEQLKCTSTSTYERDAHKFAESFKKCKDIDIIMNVLSEHGNEYKDK